MALMESCLEEILMKVALFVLVQALVYVILSKSSNIFSKNKTIRSFSFKPPRSISIRRILAAVSDLPAGDEPSPSSRGLKRSSTQEYSPFIDDYES
ncbi:hypothetical protein HS088_TW15G01247 [Tripterygium wilfordii]|uniref:Uncharacterized protein n=1 Tax=Tripterygium wilfordii TaxID=458696 RepID=A0A7J7CNV7_TRIWF|nr:uncharacterized protein LOC119979945 [Tripterygium wilfordii]KAF5735731.1 hypothetical protein HS088_TW15G01247 [Tripterygium wilfordii]